MWNLIVWRSNFHYLCPLFIHQPHALSYTQTHKANSTESPLHWWDGITWPLLPHHPNSSVLDRNLNSMQLPRHPKSVLIFWQLPWNVDKCPWLTDINNFNCFQEYSTRVLWQFNANRFWTKLDFTLLTDCWNSISLIYSSLLGYLNQLHIDGFHQLKQVNNSELLIIEPSLNVIVQA